GATPEIAAVAPAPVAAAPVSVVYAPVAPPAPRYEIVGVAPRADMFYTPGYWRWSGAQYTWIVGRWETRRDGCEYVSSRWERSGNRWTFVPGCWVEHDARRPVASDRHDGRDHRDGRDGRDHRDGAGHEHGHTP